MKSIRKIVSYIAKGAFVTLAITLSTSLPYLWVADDLTLHDVWIINTRLFPFLTPVMIFILVYCDLVMKQIKERKRKRDGWKQ